MIITVCMGSSCFSRDNSSNAETVQRIVDDKGLGKIVTVKGCLCEGECKNGPNVRINDTLFSHVVSENLEDLIMHELEIEQRSGT